MITVTVLAVWSVAAVAVCWANHRWHRAQADPSTVELPLFGSDPDDDTVRVTELPPVPPVERWTDADDAMLAWYAAGRAER